MNKKKIFIIAIVVLVIIFVISKVSLDLYKETKIRNEIKYLVKLINNDTENTKEINKVLERTIIKKGKYNKVETSIKKYYKEYYLSYSNFIFITDKENYKEYLNPENLKDKNITLINSQKNIENTSNQIEEIYTEIINKINNNSEKIPYINEHNLSIYYKEFYLSLINNNLTESTIKDITSIKDSAQDTLLIYQDAILYLTTYNTKWKINNGEVIFNSKNLNNEYQNIIERLN